MSNKNPFSNFNIGDLMKNMQGNPATDTQETNSLFKSVSDAFFKSNQPKDLGELWEMQKKNLAQLADKDTHLSDKFTKVAKEQVEVFQEAWKTYEHYAKKAEKGENVDKSAMQKAQDAMLKAMGNMQELSQKGADLSEKNADDLQSRMKDSVGDLQSLLKKFGGK